MPVAPIAALSLVARDGLCSQVNIQPLTAIRMGKINRSKKRVEAHRGDGHMVDDPQ